MDGIRGKLRIHSQENLRREGKNPEGGSPQPLTNLRVVTAPRMAAHAPNRRAFTLHRREDGDCRVERIINYCCFVSTYQALSQVLCTHSI